MSIDKTQVEAYLRKIHCMDCERPDDFCTGIFEKDIIAIQSLISDITTEAELRGEIKGRTTIFELLKSTGTITEADVLAQPH
jgi:hypothetical protein